MQLLKINSKYSLNIEIPECVMSLKKNKQIPTRGALNMKLMGREDLLHLQVGS